MKKFLFIRIDFSKSTFDVTLLENIVEQSCDFAEKEKSITFADILKCQFYLVFAEKSKTLILL